MIHVEKQLEPESFNEKVRKKGLSWLKKHHLTVGDKIPSDKRLPPYWLACFDDLYKSYNGYCAYLAIFLEKPTGVATIDHFVAKSKRIDLAYEWDNYRLSSSRINNIKSDFDDILDPFFIEDGWFHLELLTGRIYPNPSLQKMQRSQISNTIQRLKLDACDLREMRKKHYLDYVQGECTSNFLKKHSPFVWMEANRQGAL